MSHFSFSVSFSDIQSNKYKLSMDNYIKNTGLSENAVRLGELCDVLIGGTPDRSNLAYWGGNNLWVKISDMQQKYIDDTEEKITDKGIQESSVKLLEEGTVLLSFKLTVGKVAIAKRGLYTNEAIAGIIPKDNRVLAKYLYYILPHIDYTSYRQRATKGKTLNKEIIKSVRIPLPSPVKQKEIVARLDKKEAEIDYLNEQIANIVRKEKEIVLEASNE